MRKDARDDHQLCALPSATPLHLPERCRALCMGLKTEIGRLLDSGMGLWWMGTGYVVGSRLASRDGTA